MLWRGRVRVDHIVENGTVGARHRAAHQCQHGRRDVDQLAGSVDSPVGPNAGAGDDERRSRLHDIERAVLTEVTALVGPVVRRRVDHTQVGSGRVVEDLRGLLVRERIAVGGPGRLQRAELTCESRKAVRGLVGQWVPAR